MCESDSPLAGEVGAKRREGVSTVEQRDLAPSLILLRHERFRRGHLWI